MCHHDGSSLDRNKLRIYHDPSTDKMVFIPHGMDLIFDDPGRDLEPQFRGTVARAVLETAQGRQLYQQRLKELGQLAYGTEELSARARELVTLLQPAFAGERQRRNFESSASQLQSFLRTRREFVLKQLVNR